MPKPPASPTIAELIQEYCDSKQVPDTIAAQPLGVAQSTFQRWRTGGHVPDESRIPDLARFLGKDENTIALAISNGRRSAGLASSRRPADANLGERVSALEVQISQLRGEVQGLVRLLREARRGRH